MQVIWSRLDEVDEGERLRIEARLESLTRHAPVARIQIEGSPPDADLTRETVRITGKVDGMQVVAVRDELTLGEALEYALRAFEESIMRMSGRWAEKPLAAVEQPDEAAPATPRLRGPSAGPTPVQLRGPAPKVIELAPEKPSLGVRIREGLGGGLRLLGRLRRVRLRGLRLRLPARSPAFRKASLGVSLVALLVALAAERCDYNPDLSEVAAGVPRGFSAEAGAEGSFSAVSRSERATPRSFSARSLDSDAPGESIAGPEFSAESEDFGFDYAYPDEAPLDPDLEDPAFRDPAFEERAERADVVPEEPQRPGVLRRRR